MRIIVVIGLIAGLLLVLSWRFPYAVGSESDKERLVYFSLLLLLMAAGTRLGRYIPRSQAMRQAGVWVAICLLLVLGYSYRNQFRNSQLVAELIPNSVQVTSDGALTVRSAEDGHFYVEAEVNGVTVNFLIDTGASDIVLSPDDARRVGFSIDTLNYTKRYSTANGSGNGAPVRLAVLAIGSITLHDLPASVNKARMKNSLLGMEFLRRLNSYNVDGNTLTMTPGKK